MHRSSCPDRVVVNHQAEPDGLQSSPYYFAQPEATNSKDQLGPLSHQGNKHDTGDVLPKKGPTGFNDGGHLTESTVGSRGYFSGTADYSSYSYRSKIATVSSSISEPPTKPTSLQRAHFKGGCAKADYKSLGVSKKCLEPTLEQPNAGHNAQTAQVTSHKPDRLKSYLQTPMHTSVTKPDKNAERKPADCYKKAIYAVLIGDTVRVCDTKLYASLPSCNKYMVKERTKDAVGNTRVKLSLKTYNGRLVLFSTK